VAAVALVVVPLLAPGARDQVATLRGLGLATTVGMTVAGVGLLVAIARAAGASALAGLARTGPVVAAVATAGAFAGRMVTDLTTADGAGRALAAGAAGALTCGVVVVTLAWAGDRSALRALGGPRGGDAARPGSAPPPGDVTTVG
jgi:putative peptidoglycan lipid II flippase